LIPVLFALGSASPIAFIAWLFYKGVEERLNVWMKFQKFEYWFRKITAVIFILTGILFVIEYYFEG
jgi:cytochrome c biogenesis protein CcdA